MEMEMTLSRLADWIIVISFFSLCGAGIGHVIAQLVCLGVDNIKDWRKRRKEQKEQPTE